MMLKIPSITLLSLHPLASGIANEFQNRNLNNWLQVKVNSYVSLEDLEKAVIPRFNIDGRTVYIGYDKGQFSDDNAIAFVYPYEGNGVGKFHVEQFSFIPLRNSNNDINIKEHQDGINYRAEVEKGFGRITENIYGIVEDDEVCNWLLDYVETHNLQVKAFCYDYYHETSMTGRIIKNTDWVCIPVHQGVRSLNEPTRFFRDELHQERITMLNDGILQYSLKNALLFEENNGIKINKDKRTSKIDAVDALIDAFFEAMYYFDGLSNVKTKSIWDNKTTDEINDYFMNDFSF
ncbi:terminase TerL endonuclease subunit [Pediococcus pentosaceus]|uniref:terminase TerL endonuclease subunit n=1 Tax=Pediococcus pentosaceus TaxID=1255 RepID=UPI0013E8CD01|nr:terminase TerL endonuclease subunit [Pediococcus pentosaceus]